MDRYQNPYRTEMATCSELSSADDVCDASPTTSAVDDARTLIQLLGNDARLTVATGATAQFAEWLGWPFWFKDGTAIPPGDSLPSRITLADDLILIANIVDHGKAASIIARLYGDFKIPGAPITVPALYNAPTLHDALQFFVRTAAFGSPFLQVALHQHENEFHISIDSGLRRGAMRDFCSIAMLSIAHRFVTFFVNDDAPKVCMHIEAKKTSDLVQPLEKLSCKIAHGADQYGLHGLTSWLPIQNVRSDRAFWNFALERMAVAERSDVKSEIVSRIRSVIRATMQSEGRVPRLKQIAVIEGVSERTLVRALAAQSIKFHQIVEEERRIKAAELIGNASISLSEIARSLGFTDMSSFGRSYRQWFGVTPGQARSRRDA